ncbi:cyclic nucleotide-binding domain-containing protein [Aquabacterium sp.]|uniref:cyclic nucleotide-binding domain-containing protein n=1 Tax=Aquabacterium sp. TaxID=1872578 RepID=UPI002BEDE751|nr:cyclic nucleotide-binding domain-containing protein [Aquabacterium sp.]HSW03752.1 cyclic nucleotide-binding domain-containing protein [Aquabacterium sp.]
MKTLLSRLRGRRAAGPADAGDSLPATSLLPPDEVIAPPVQWADRATELKAKPTDPAEAARQLLKLWRGDAPLAAIGDAAAPRLAPWLAAADVASGQQPILQDEGGDFLLVLLEGRVSVERQHPGGAATRLFEARAGDLLGEMALFDGGPRFCACRTLTPCTLAVLDSGALQRLMSDDPALAAAVLASITRRLSLRLRQTGARLSALLAPQ